MVVTEEERNLETVKRWMHFYNTAVSAVEKGIDRAGIVT